MKKALPLLATLLIVFTGCGGAGVENNSEPYIPYQAVVEESPPNLIAEPQLPTPPPGPIPLNRAAQFFGEIDSLFDEDSGELWGFYLHVPIIFVDPETCIAVANRPDFDGVLERQGDVYVSLFPEKLQVFDAVVTFDYFGGKLWVIVPWPSIQHRDIEGRLFKLTHKAMHWHQHAFLDDFHVGGNSHMNELDARISIRIEVNALIHAFSATDEEERFSAIADALSIRAWRRQIFGAETSENRLEIIEGLALYTEWALNMSDRNNLIGIANSFAEGMVSGLNLENSFGYLSGALYAFLLNELDITWKDGLNGDSNLGQMLKEAMGITELRDINEIVLNFYGYEQIGREEREWVEFQNYTLNRVIESIQSHPTMQFHWDDYEHHGVAFNGSRFSFADLGTVFRGNVEFFGSFGRLYVRNSELIFHNDGFIMVVAEDMEIEDNLVTARHWTLELNDGYEAIVYYDNFRVVKR